MNPSKFFALVIVSLAAATSFGQANVSRVIESPAPPKGGWSRGKYDVPRVETAPKVDGELNDPCWKNALHAKGFFRFIGKEEVTDQTEAWICTDKEKIYLAMHCLDKNPNSIVAKETQRNGNLEQDDRVGILIDSQFTRRNGSIFWVNPNGTQNQELEGGSAENQAWQGDWKAFAKKTADGWQVELEVPFRLLRYPKNAKTFGILVVRKKATESNFTSWPYSPPESDNGRITQFLSDFHGFNPPTYAPKPTILPYTLATTGQGTSARFGLDVKYPFSTSLTGVATIKPDFQTVEGAVQDLSFSYTERYIPDRRPFFAEGSGFLDDSSLFYSQRITDVDFGLKVTGKQGPTTLGVLATSANVGSKQQAKVATFDQEVGAYSSFGGTWLDNQQAGNSGSVGQIRGQYGWSKGVRKDTFFGNLTRSNSDGGMHGGSDFLMFRSNAGKDNLNGNVYYTRTDKNFANPLGLVSEVDSKGIGINLHTFSVRPKGAIETVNYFGGGEAFEHIDGSFFHKSIYYGTEVGLRNGLGYGINGSTGARDSFNDRSLGGFFGWNQKSLLSKGNLSFDTGRRENKDYRFVALSQGFPIGKLFSLNLSVGQQKLGSEIQNQAILNGTYRIDPMQSFGGRLVAQGGNTNLYLSYGKRTRTGNDIFVLLGDPNSPTTKRAISLKMVWSLGH